MSRTHMPLLTVAPNGARRGKADHPALPVTIDETAETARACLDAGADAIHLHVRDAGGGHVLDAGLYARAVAAVDRATGGRLFVQVTTESAGLYAPADLRRLLAEVEAPAVSIALRELLPDGAGEAEEAAAADCYRSVRARGILIQHFLHTPADLDRFCALAARGVVPDDTLDLLFVLGRHGADDTDPAQLAEYLTRLGRGGLAGRAEWAVCAFGRMETRGLAAALAMGGKARVGFENSLHHADGTRARDNADRVAAIARIVAALGRGPGADRLP